MAKVQARESRHEFRSEGPGLSVAYTAFGGVSGANHGARAAKGEAFRKQLNQTYPYRIIPARLTDGPSSRIFACLTDEPPS